MTETEAPQSKIVSRRLQLSLLAFLILINILLRFPFTPHENGWDSFFIHSISDSITTNGNAVWVLHPLSLFGLFPFSYASGAPFLLSSTSQIADINMESTILLFSIFLGIFSIFTSFLMAGEIKRNFKFQYLVAFFYSTSLGLLSFTTWTISTRGVFMAFFPLFIFSFLKWYNTQRDSYAILTILTFICLVSLHNLFFLAVPILLLIPIAKILNKIKFTYRSRYPREKQRPNAVFLAIIVFLIFLFALPLVLSAFGDYIQQFMPQYTTDNPMSWYTSAALAYGRKAGIPSILAALGFFWLIRKYAKETRELFIIVTVFAFIPIFLAINYVSLMILPFLCLLAAYGGIYLLRKKNKKWTATLLALCILSVGASAFYQVSTTSVISYTTYTDRYMDDHTYSAGIYIMQNNCSPFTGNEDVTKVRISGMFGVPQFSGLEAEHIINGYISPEDIYVKLRSPVDPKFYTDNPFIVEDRIGKQLIWYSGWLRRNHPDQDNVIYVLERYNIRYEIQNNQAYLDHVRANDGNYAFEIGIRNTRYNIYDNGMISVWYIDSYKVNS